MDMVIHPTDYPLPHPPLMAWARSNFIIPNCLAASSPITISGNQITYVELFRGEDGKTVYLPKEDQLAKRTVTTKLYTLPAEFGL